MRRRRRPSRSTAAVGVLGLVGWLGPVAGCADAPDTRRPPSAEAPGVPSEHAVSGAALRERMRSFRPLRWNGLPAALQDEQRRDLERIGEAMARSAEVLPDVLDTTGLGPDQEADFYALAGRLRLRALELSRMAPGASRDELDRQVDAVDSVCDGCHARFRLPGERAPGDD